MKKKVFYLLLFLIVGAFAVYQYVYKSHRDIASEKANFTTTVQDVFTSFTENDSTANTKYLDKTIVIRGKISNIDYSGKIIMVDEKLSARFTDKLPEKLKLQDSIVLKGRLIGFDDLLGEIQLDQSTIVE
ncbi:MAG: hypothetical protein KAX93_03560 [Flavobacterium sp.]|nr:hypothetical protein [Flavobacterium sp.]